MHAAGYRVVVTYSPGNKRVKDWLAEQKESGREFTAYPVDVTDFDSCKNCIGQITNDVGPVDILVNNAGRTRDTRKEVTVNTISPGYIGTKTAIPKDVLDSKILPQIPIGRLGKPEEIAGPIIYLCSDEAAFVTGANIAINGGQHMQ